VNWYQQSNYLLINYLKPFLTTQTHRRIYTDQQNSLSNQTESCDEETEQEHVQQQTKTQFQKQYDPDDQNL
jgi:hypothetical protein